MSRVSLRTAGPGDLHAIRALLRAAALPDEDLDAALIAHFLVAEESAQLVGAVGLQVISDHALLRSLVVAPAWRRRGFGAALCAAAEERARDLRLMNLWLLTTTAVEFFAARGYREVRREDAPAAIRASREFAALCPDSARCLTRTP